MSYLTTESESEDSSSVNHHFNNDSEFSNSYISQIDAEFNSALALNLSRTPRLTINGEDVIIIHKKKEASKNDRMMVIFTASKYGWDDYSITYNMKLRVAKATCGQVAYGYGFKCIFLFSQLPHWKKKIDSTTEGKMF